jgi:hypothetical protein
MDPNRIRASTKQEINPFFNVYEEYQKKNIITEKN